MTIYHIVLVKYTPEATPAQRAAWTTGINALLDGIPQLKELKGGPKIPHKLDGGWEDGVIGLFDSREDLQAYIVSEPHVKFVREVVPYVADTLIFDIDG